jgi:hypothetical protein
MDQSPSPETLKPAAWWSGSLHDFMATEEPALLGVLSHAAARTFRVNELTQLRAWSEEIRILRGIVPVLPQASDWRLLLEFQIPRLGGRIDAVLLAPVAIFVLEFKVGAVHFAEDARQQAEDYALDLQDFHAGSRRHPVVPILVATDAAEPPQTLPFPFPGAAPEVLQADGASLPALLRMLAARFPTPSRPIDTGAWEHAPYQPASCLPGIMWPRSSAPALTLTI